MNYLYGSQEIKLFLEHLSALKGFLNHTLCICCTLQLALYVYLGTKKWLKITWQEKKETTTKQLSMTQTTKQYQISELWLLNQGMVVIKTNDELKQLFVFSTFLILLLRKPCVLSYGCEKTFWSTWYLCQYIWSLSISINYLTSASSYIQVWTHMGVFEICGNILL